MRFLPGLSADDVSKPQTGCTIVACQVLGNGENVLLVDRHHFLEVMQQLHFETNEGSIQKQNLVHPIVRKDRVSVHESKVINLSRIANNVIGAVHHDSKFFPSSKK